MKPVVLAILTALLTLTAGLAPAAADGWTCSAIGFRTYRVPAPQRLFFSARRATIPAAMSAAMGKCRRDDQVTPGTCQRGTCRRG